MGLLKKIKKGIKGVFKGVGKVFKKVVGTVSKVLNSKFGKVLMTALAVFTAGTALVAGVGTFTQTAGGFMTKFVAGSKAFIGALAHPFKTAGELMNSANAAQGATAGAGQVAKAAQATAETASAVGNTAAAAPVDVLASAAGKGTTSGIEEILVRASDSKPSLYGKALDLAKSTGKGVLDFAKTAGGGALLGNVIQGYGEGAMQEKLLKQQAKEARYYDNAWRDPAALAMLKDSVRDIDVPSGYLDRARRVNDFLNNRPYGSMPAAPGAPEDVFGTYVRGSY